MRDWVPFRYRYDTVTRQPLDAGYEESSPAELASYRALYAHSMEMEVGKMTGGSDTATTFGTLPKNEAAVTRRSLVMRSLDLSAGDPWAALATVNHIIDQIEELTAPEWDDSDSDMSSFTSCSSVNSDEEDDNDDEEDEEDETCGQVLSGMKCDASEHQDGTEFGDVVVSMPELDMEFSNDLQAVAEQKQVSPSFSEGFQSKVEQNTQDSSQLNPQDGILAASGPLSCIREVLRVGCDIAKTGCELLAEVEKCHRESSVESTFGPVAKSEPVRAGKPEDSRSPEYTKEQAPSIQVAVHLEQIKPSPTTVDAQDIPARKAELLQAAKSEKKAVQKAHYLADKAAIKKDLKVWENIALAVWCRGVSLEQLQLNQGKIAEWVVATFREEQEREDHQPPALQLQPAVEGTTAAVKMANNGGTALTSFEDDVWLSKEESQEIQLTRDMLHAAKVDCDEPSPAVNIGLKSRTHRSFSETLSLPVQALPESQDNTFNIFEDNKDEPEPSTAIPSGTQPQAASCYTQTSRTSRAFGVAKKTTKPAAARKVELLPALGNKTPPLESSSNTTLPKDAAPVNKPAMPSDRDALASRSHLERKNIVNYQETALNLTNAMKVPQLPGSYPNFEDDDVLQISEATHKVRALCNSWTSYFTNRMFNRDEPQLDKESLSPDSSVSSYKGDEYIGSDVGGAHSSATSLSDGQAEYEDYKELKEDRDNTLGRTVTATGECGGCGDEYDIQTNGGRFEADRMREVKGRIDHHNLADFIKTSLKEQAAQKVYDPSSEEWADDSKFAEIIKAGNSAATVGEPQVGGNVDAGNDGLGVGADNNDNNQENHHAEDNELGNDDVDQENQAAQDEGLEIPEFEDSGEFDHYTICNLLGRGELDELRLLRLKEGFLKLLEQY